MGKEFRHMVRKSVQNLQAMSQGQGLLVGIANHFKRRIRQKKASVTIQRFVRGFLTRIKYSDSWASNLTLMREKFTVSVEKERETWVKEMAITKRKYSNEEWLFKWRPDGSEIGRLASLDWRLEYRYLGHPEVKRYLKRQRIDAL